LGVDSKQFSSIVKGAKQVMKWGWLGRLGHFSQLGDHLEE